MSRPSTLRLVQRREKAGLPETAWYTEIGVRGENKEMVADFIELPVIRTSGEREMISLRVGYIDQFVKSDQDERQSFLWPNDDVETPLVVDLPYEVLKKALTVRSVR